ncbi:cysteine--tRNA ligase [Desulfonema limicola]|nr:cysteine--tRNA ligase [Desulfonema limicola]
MSYSILDAIGNTPIVEIRKLNPNPQVKILAKMEYMNPGGSIKDRPALYMIEAGEKSGELTHAKTVIEATSGNTGIGLALVCAVKGYKLLLAMSEAASMERRKILKARGADILLTPGHMGTDGAIEEVYRLVREYPDTYFMADQYNTEANWKAHYYGTGVEIWEQTQGEITTLVATLGTSGTLMGLSRRLKEYNPDIQIVGVEPYLGHKIQGLKNMKEAYQPGLFEKDRLDKKVNIEDEDAFEMTRKLAREEGLFVGMSSGAAMAVAAQEAKSMTKGTIVVIFPDSGERYLTTSLFTVDKKIDMKVFNTMSRTKEVLEPYVPGKVSIYSCGPTAHARLRPGEWRRFVFADLLCRYLRYRDYDVTHVMNITDLDDKTINGSASAGMEIKAFTRQYIDAFEKDREILGIDPADHYPKASEHVGDMVAIAEKLVMKGYAYEKLRSLYFDISKFEDYGSLSGIDLDKIRLGATVDLDEYEKENPRDFTLFKRCSLSELKRGIYTTTDWGNARPSWHIQCAAMSMKYLGDSFDIHTSARKLVFPHHENEIAIAKALSGKPLARYWMHCDRVLMDGKKMDENLPMLTIEQLVDVGYSGKDIRYWLISTHYRKPVRFSTERLDASKQSLKRINSCIQSLKDVNSGSPYPELDQLLYDIKQGFINAMDDDLNISAAMASIFQQVKIINKLILESKIDPEGAGKLIDGFKNINTVLNVFDFDNSISKQEIKNLLKKREAARNEKNWELADKIRSQLEEQGINIRDQKLYS